MTITLLPDIETRLLEQAKREGRDFDAVANDLLANALDWNAHSDAEELEAIRVGLAACDAGRLRPFSEFASEMRAKHQLPTYLSNTDLVTPK